MRYGKSATATVSSWDLPRSVIPAPGAATPRPGLVAYARIMSRGPGNSQVVCAP